MTRRRQLLGVVLYRLDAWGVALIVSLVAILLHDALTPRALALAFGVAGLYAIGYAANDYFDAAADMRDQTKARLNLFIAHPLPPARAGALFGAALALVAVPFLAYGTRGIAFLATGIVAAWAYSAPPLRLKVRPGLDLLTHAVFVQTFAYATCLVLLDVEWKPVDAVVLGVNFLASLSGQLAQQLRDFDLDSLGDRTFTTAMGTRIAAACLRVVTGLLFALVFAGVTKRLIPLSLAPLALAFVPAALRRLRAERHVGFSPGAAVATGGALLWVGVLLLIDVT